MERGKKMLISIDHGYSQIKTQNFIFPSSITQFDQQPYTEKGLLEYAGKYYVCGTGQKAIIRDKMEDNTYFLLTLIAIAKEMQRADVGQRAVINIAAGLPLTNFGRDKERFINYLKRNGQKTRFNYEGKPYVIEVEEVKLYPQGYAAILQYIEDYQAAPAIIVCDIGAWTVDTMIMNNGVPNPETCRSLEFGIKRCIERTIEEIRREHGVSVTPEQIDSVLRGQKGVMLSDAERITKVQQRRYANELMRLLVENGFDIAAVPIVFLGGGAIVVEKYVDSHPNIFNPTIIDDVKANAKGYRTIALNQLAKGSIA